MGQGGRQLGAGKAGGCGPYCRGQAQMPWSALRGETSPKPPHLLVTTTRRGCHQSRSIHQETGNGQGNFLQPGTPTFSLGSMSLAPCLSATPRCHIIVDEADFCKLHTSYTPLPGGGPIIAHTAQLQSRSAPTMTWALTPGEAGGGHDPCVRHQRCHNSTYTRQGVSSRTNGLSQHSAPDAK